VGEDVAGREHEGAAEDCRERTPDRFQSGIERSPEGELFTDRDGDRRDRQRDGQNGGALPAHGGGQEQHGGDGKPSQELEPEVVAAQAEGLRLPAEGAEAEGEPPQSNGRNGPGRPFEKHATPFEGDDENGDHGQADHRRNASVLELVSWTLGTLP